MAKSTKQQCSINMDRKWCSIPKTADILDGKWTILVFRDLLRGSVRFNQLKKSVGAISPKTLSARLQFLEKAGVITRTVYPDVPPRVEYTITPKGQALAPILEAMDAYGDKWLK